MKVYVTERKVRTVDDEELTVIETHKSKPHDFKYIIFTRR